jgi:SAM-dependent methyltransferase
MAKTDDSWDKFGKVDPYYGVLSDDRFRKSTMAGDARAEFFRSGEEHVEKVFDTIRKHIDSDFSPRSVFDFGCGVGRLAIPLARRVAHVTAADVSGAMLSEAARNCVEQNIHNIAFMKSDDTLDGLPSSIEFIHSFIVFQHIPTARGLAILNRLLELLVEDGIGALHFTFARHASRILTFLQRTCGSVPFANNFYNLARGKSFSHPHMEMNHYDMNKILDVLYRHDCHDVHVRFSNHGGFIGAMIYFRRRSIAPL